MNITTIIRLLILFILIILVIVLIYKNSIERYEVAKDESSIELFERLKTDLSQLYPDLSNINIKGIVSCVPEDSFTENKKNVCICLRNKSGSFYNYSKLLKIGIHELAHVMSKQHDPEHKTKEFIDNYSSLMKKASDLGFSVE